MAIQKRQFTAAYQKVKGGFVGWIEEVSGVNTQGKTLAETKKNLSDAFALVMETNRLLAKQEMRGQNVVREPFVVSL